MMRTAGLYYSPHPILSSDIARIDPDLISSMLNRRDRKAVIKMNIRYQRDMYIFLDLFQCFRCCPVRYCNPYDLTSRLLQAQNLLNGRLRVLRLGIGHGLNPHWITAADLDTADLYCSGLLSRIHFMPLYTNNRTMS